MPKATIALTYEEALYIAELLGCVENIKNGNTSLVENIFMPPHAASDPEDAAFRALRIPSPLQSPAGARTVTADRIQGEFVAANGGMPHDAITVHCAGRFLSEVRVCLTREGKPRPCPQAMLRQACRVPEIIVQPVR